MKKNEPIFSQNDEQTYSIPTVIETLSRTVGGLFVATAIVEYGQSLYESTLGGSAAVVKAYNEQGLIFSEMALPFTVVYAAMAFARGVRSHNTGNS